MRCLLVEDEAERIAKILPELKKIFGDASIDVASDRDTAVKYIDSHAFDLIVLDQRIPSRPGQLDGDVAHGRAVLNHVKNVTPDTPVYFLTGLPMEEDYVDQLIADGDRCDVWGDGKPVPLIRRFTKMTMAPFYQAATEIAATARITDDIEINTKGMPIQLNPDHMRLLKSFTRLHGGVCADIDVLSGGFSGVSVIRSIIKDANGGVRLAVASKLGDADKIAREVSHFEREVVRLPPGAYAPLTGQAAQVGRSKGAFYRLLDGYDQSLFHVLNSSDANAAGCVSLIRSHEEPWFKNSIVIKARVGELLRLLVWEDRLPAIHALMVGIDWSAYEGKEISVRMCTRHGDLHGENVLVNSSLRAMMIDYGAVDHLPSAIDAVTLELSPFFHPNGQRSALRWQTGDAAIDWFDRKAFCELSTIPRYVGVCRDWAHGESFGDREVLACAYMYVLRQLQFDSADRELARALAAGIVSRGLQI
jgi:CheY-like chemotaxis protein